MVFRLIEVVKAFILGIGNMKRMEFFILMD